MLPCIGLFRQNDYNVYFFISRSKTNAAISKDKTMSSMTVPMQAATNPTSLTSTIRSCKSPNSLRMNSSSTMVTPHQPPEVETNKVQNENKTRITTVVPGLSSPTDSTSDTSDYQRSTPSPKEEEGSSTGNLTK